jgi:uncharacterized short protein YbdD (DUF466 family)
MGLFRKWWNALGLIMGEGEYARYCEHLRIKHPERALPTAGEFWVTRLKEKYSRPNRCC